MKPLSFKQFAKIPAIDLRNKRELSVYRANSNDDVVFVFTNVKPVGDIVGTCSVTDLRQATKAAPIVAKGLHEVVKGTRSGHILYGYVKKP